MISEWALGLSSQPPSLFSSQEGYLPVVIRYAASFCSQVLWLSHRLIIELLVVQSIRDWDHVQFLESAEHVFTMWWIETWPCLPGITHTFCPRSSTLNRFSGLTHKLYWPSMLWIELKSLCYVLYRSIKILPLSSWPM